MKLPNGRRAIVDLHKLTRYVLFPRHARGKHKARAFATRVGLTAKDAARLRVLLLQAAVLNRNAEALGDDASAQRFTLDLQVAGRNGTGTVRSTWLVSKAEGLPRLMSCYLL